jgi:ribose transport system substrate-binding protein
MLQAEPDLDVLVSAYADITVGAAQAVRQAGRSGVQIFDLGGAENELPFISDGTITASAAYSPRGHARAALEAVLLAFSGQPVERYASGLTYGDTAAPHLVDRTTVAGYRPEF